MFGSRVWAVLPTLFLLQMLIGSGHLSELKREIFVETKEFTINSKTICASELGIQYERVSCPFNNKLEIINSGLYNGSARLNYTATSICLPVDHTTHIVKSVTQLLKMECSQYSCLISMDTIKRLLDEPTLINLNDLILDINYSCQASDLDGSSSRPRAYSFTYFFYIITLVLSTSCILVGAIFILRKFLVMRRRNMLMADRARQSQGYQPNSQADQGNNNNGFDTQSRVWTTTAYPPPSYDNIYESSLPINPLPDYDSSLNNLAKKGKTPDQQKTEQPDTESIRQRPVLAAQAQSMPNADSYSVTFSNPDEMVTITNNNFNLNAAVSDASNANLSSTDSSHTISVDDLQIADKAAVINGQRLNERMKNQKL